MTHAPTGLDALLAQAQTAAPMDRIDLRDPIAAYGEQAIDAMTDWLGDPRLAAFAIRVLERIAREPANREAVVATLAAVDQDQLGAGPRRRHPGWCSPTWAPTSRVGPSRATTPRSPSG